MSEILELTTTSTKSSSSADNHPSGESRAWVARRGEEYGEPGKIGFLVIRGQLEGDGKGFFSTLRLELRTEPNQTERDWLRGDIPCQDLGGDREARQQDEMNHSTDVFQRKEEYVVGILIAENMKSSNPLR